MSLIVNQFSDFLRKVPPPYIQDAFILLTHYDTESLADIELAKIAFFLDDYTVEHYFANFTKRELSGILYNFQKFKESPPEIYECVESINKLMSTWAAKAEVNVPHIEELEKEDSFNNSIINLSRDSSDYKSIISFVISANSLSRREGFLGLENYFDQIESANLSYLRIALELVCNGNQLFIVRYRLAQTLHNIGFIQRNLILEGVCGMGAGDNNQILYSNLYCILRENGISLL